MNCPTCDDRMHDTQATRDRIVGHETVRGMKADVCTIDGVQWCGRCGTVVFDDQDGNAATTLVPKDAQKRGGT